MKIDMPKVNEIMIIYMYNIHIESVEVHTLSLCSDLSPHQRDLFQTIHPFRDKMCPLSEYLLYNCPPHRDLLVRS